MNQKKVFLAAITLGSLLFLGCGKAAPAPVVETPVEPVAPVISSCAGGTLDLAQAVMTPDEIVKFNSAQGVEFKHPKNWHLLDRGTLTGGLDFWTGAFGTVNRLDQIAINFDREISKKDEAVDMTITDVAFAKAPKSIRDYAEKMTKGWSECGTLSPYQEGDSQDFVVWAGPGPVFDGDYVMAVAAYIDNGDYHFVEVSAMGADKNEIWKKLQPVIRSMKFGTIAF